MEFRRLVVLVALLFPLGVGAQQYNEAHPPSGPGPIWRATFEGGASDCTGATHCSNASACADTNVSGYDCNETTGGAPQGAAYLRHDCSTDTRPFYLLDAAQRPAGEFWIKWHARPNLASPINKRFFRLGPDDGLDFACAGATAWRIEFSTAAALEQCDQGTTQGSGAEFVNNTWGEWKMRVDLAAGTSDLWIPGDDFTGTPHISITGASDPSEVLGRISLEGIDSANCTTIDIDDIRVYDEDPD